MNWIRNMILDVLFITYMGTVVGTVSAEYVINEGSWVDIDRPDNIMF